jgi:hypothetical protein
MERDHGTARHDAAALANTESHTDSGEYGN